MIHILQRRKSSPREVKPVAKGHTASGGQNLGSTLGLSSFKSNVLFTLCCARNMDLNKK